jgi:hypothetical protein
VAYVLVICRPSKPLERWYLSRCRRERDGHGGVQRRRLDRSTKGYSATPGLSPVNTKALLTAQAACRGQNFGGSLAGSQTP